MQLRRIWQLFLFVRECCSLTSKKNIARAATNAVPINATVVVLLVSFKGLRLNA